MNFHIDDLLSTESVKYNANSPLRKLFIGIASACVTVYKETVDKGDTEIYRALSDVLSESSHMVREHTGIDVTLKVKVPNESAHDNSSGYTVEVEIPKMALTPSSLYPKLSDREMDQLLAGKEVGVVSGSMDLVTSKVSGIYSKIGFTISSGVDLFRPEFLTEEEIAAILLHEMGHIWDFLSNLGEIARGVAVTAYARKVITGNYTYERKLKIIDALGLTTEDPTALGVNELTTLVAMHALARNKTLQASVIYSKNVEEHIADAFAAMHGLAYATATAMRKLEMERSLFTRSRDYKPVWVGVFDLVNEFLAGLSLGYALGAGTGLMGPLVTPILISATTKAIPYFGNKVAVTPHDRIVKMRESLTAALKDPSTSESERKLIVADIRVLNGESKTIRANTAFAKSVLDGLKDIVNNFIPVSQAKQQYYTRTNLDSLTDNRLFEITARLNQGF